LGHHTEVEGSGMNQGGSPLIIRFRLSKELRPPQV
jgi:hypothetical protein